MCSIWTSCVDCLVSCQKCNLIFLIEWVWKMWMLLWCHQKDSERRWSWRKWNGGMEQEMRVWCVYDVFTCVHVTTDVFVILAFILCRAETSRAATSSIFYYPSIWGHYSSSTRIFVYQWGGGGVRAERSAAQCSAMWAESGAQESKDSRTAVLLER